MSKIYEAVIVAIRDHWKKNDNRYPLKISLTEAQHRELLEHRRAGQVALNDISEPEADKFMGTPLDSLAGTAAVIIAIDGTETILTVSE